MCAHVERSSPELSPEDAKLRLAYAQHLLKAAQDLPDLPPLVELPGSDPLSIAIATMQNEVVKPLHDGRAGMKADMIRDAEDLVDRAQAVLGSTRSDSEIDLARQPAATSVNESTAQGFWVDQESGGQ